MKKNISIFVVVLVAFMFNVISVSAAPTTSTCTYGKRDGDKFTAMVQFQIDSDGGVILNVANSPFLGSNVDPNKWTQDSSVSKNFNFVGIYSDNTTVTAKLFADKQELTDMAEITNSLCPSSIIYKHKEETCVPITTTPVVVPAGTTKTKYVKFLGSDMLDKDSDYEEHPVKEFFKNLAGCWTNNKGAYEKETLVEKNWESTVESSECSTYDNHMQILEFSKRKVSNNSCDGNYWFDKEYERIQTLCSNFRETSYYTDQSSDDGVAKKCMTACSRFYDDVEKICGSSNPEAGCNSLGGGLLNWIFKIIKFVRYGVPALLIVLSVLDYIKALASDSDDEMKKVNTKFFKRLVAAALIFIVPFVLEFIIGLFNLPGLNSLFCAD